MARYKEFPDIIVDSINATSAEIGSLIIDALQDIYYADPNAADHGDINEEGSIAYIVDQVSGSDKQIELRPGNYILDTDLTVPSNISLRFNKGAVIDGSATFTINSSIDTGVWQVFGDNLGVAGSPNIDAVYPEWFGAVGDGNTNDLASFNKAISLKGNVILSRESYYIPTQVTIRDNLCIKSNLKNKTTIITEQGFIDNTGKIENIEINNILFSTNGDFSDYKIINFNNDSYDNIIKNIIIGECVFNVNISSSYAVYGGCVHIGGVFSKVRIENCEFNLSELYCGAVCFSFSSNDDLLEPDDPYGNWSYIKGRIYLNNNIFNGGDFGLLLASEELLLNPITVENCEFYGQHKTGLWAYHQSGSDNVYRNNVFSDINARAWVNNDGGAVWLDDGFIFEGNVITNIVGNAVYIEGSKHGVFSNNRIYKVEKRFTEYSATTSDGVTSSSFGGFGILVTDAQDKKICNNEIGACEVGSIQLNHRLGAYGDVDDLIDTSCNNLSIDNNTLNGNALILIKNSLLRLNITTNMIYEWSNDIVTSSLIDVSTDNPDKEEMFDYVASGIAVINNRFLTSERKAFSLNYEPYQSAGISFNDNIVNAGKTFDELFGFYPTLDYWDINGNQMQFSNNYATYGTGFSYPLQDYQDDNFIAFDRVVPAETNLSAYMLIFDPTIKGYRKLVLSDLKTLLGL